MNLAPGSSWPNAIRRYVYQLIVLYVVLGVIALGYAIWRTDSSDSLRRRADNFHLASANHFLKAIEELRRTQNGFSIEWVQSNFGGAHPPPGMVDDAPFNRSVSLYLIQQSIRHALALEGEFRDSRFDRLNQKLESQLEIFDRQIDITSAGGSLPDEQNVMPGHLLVSLAQLVRLHEIERERLSIRLEDMRDKQTRVFTVLIAMMLIAGILSTRRVLLAINIIIKEQVESEQRVRMFSQAIEQSPVSVLLTDTAGKLIYVNKHFEDVSGYEPQEVLGKPVDFLHPGLSAADDYLDMRATLFAGQTCDLELESHKKDGECITEKVFFSPVFNDYGRISQYLLVKEDITQHKQQAEQILYQAHYDSLTKLPNRFLALDRLSQHIKESQRTPKKVALLFLDLDDFKKVNDTMGHETGDSLLVEAAKRLQHIVRIGDTVARLGGDEFIVLLPGLLDSADAMPVADNLIKQFREAFTVAGRELILTASVGIAVYPDDGDTVSDLLRNADSAMYNAKDQGRNTYAFFTERMNREVFRRLALEEQMHGALERGEFHLLYQPKVDVGTGDIIGAEALLRWDNPVLDSVLPDEFISIAEQTGYIVPIGEFVLTRALQMTATWVQDHDRAFRIGINLSPRQFRDPNLVQFIDRSLTRSGVAAQCLELEITEGVLLSGHAYLDEALKTLHQLGVELVMDDFGKGYSSLNYLRTYPFTTIKIDRDFIEDIAGNIANQALVNASITMAHGLGLKVVAEGVETREQWEYLRALGCEFAQGYLFGKPVPAEQFTRLLERQRLAAGSQGQLI